MKTINSSTFFSSQGQALSTSTEMLSGASISYYDGASSDSRENQQFSEDFLSYQYKNNILAFVVCDGVAQSVDSGLSACLLGKEILGVLPNILGEKNRLETFLNQTRAMIQSKISNTPIQPKDSVYALFHARARNEIGAQVKFSCGVIDFNRGKVEIYWVGDVYFAVYGANSEIIFSWQNDNNQFWSTRGDYALDLGMYSGDIKNISRLSITSDGMREDFKKILNKETYLNDFEFIKLQYETGVDDISGIDIKIKSNEDIEQLSQIKNLNFTDKSLSWAPILGAEKYRIYRFANNFLENVAEVDANQQSYKIPENINEADFCVQAISSQMTSSYLSEFLHYVPTEIPSVPRKRPMPSAPPPTAAAPAPSMGFKSVIYFLIGFLLLGVGILLFSKILGNAKSLLATQILLLTLGVCFTPTIADGMTSKKGRVARVLVETTLFIVVLVLFSFWVFGKTGIGIWIGYALALTLILEIGSHLIERYSQVTLNRIVRSVSYQNLLTDAELIKKMFHSELILYVPVPVGLIAGTMVGLIKNWSALSTIIFCVQLVLSLASLILLIFLINAFARMSDALFRESKETSIKLTKNPVKKGFWGDLGIIFRFLASPPQTNKDEQEKNDLSLAYMITDLRKVYLYDAAHNVVLLVSFAFLTASLWNIPIETKWVIVTLLGVGFIFGQLPYIIGQSLLHEKVLERYEGTKRAEIYEKLKKNAPLFPTIEFLAALFTTGTAGGILYFILDQFIKSTLK